MADWRRGGVGLREEDGDGMKDGLREAIGEAAANENGNESKGGLKEKTLQIFEDFLTRVAKLEELGAVANRYLSGFQQSLGLLVKALESDWAVLSENIGLWITAEVTNPEHDDRPEGQEEQGKPVTHSLV
ncbi:unnamed protein product [Linum tenue]|uniref:DUF7795 domain-containing protein n=1 Tax=Linum tenue TaxID=586396 RepID=A0AAV0RLG3_9ROSI|nr:unnamed protein product [Linum tenue]